MRPGVFRPGAFQIVLFFCGVQVVLVDSLEPRDHFAHVLFSPSRCFVRALWVLALLERDIAPLCFSPQRFSDFQCESEGVRLSQCESM